jgi:hypothetical protein
MEEHPEPRSRKVLMVALAVGSLVVCLGIIGVIAASGIEPPDFVSSLFATPTATPTPTPTPGMGVPFSDGVVELTVTGARLDSSVISHFPFSETYTAKEGFIFLIVDAILRSVDPDRELSLSTEQFALVTEDGRIISASGGGWEDNLCVGCAHTLTGPAGWTQEEVTAIFVLSIEETGQTYKLQYRELPLIPLVIEE